MTKPPKNTETTGRHLRLRPVRDEDAAHDERMLAMAAELEREGRNAEAYVLRELARGGDHIRAIVRDIQERETQFALTTETGVQVLEILERRGREERARREAAMRADDNARGFALPAEPDVVSLWRRVIAVRDARAQAVCDWRETARSERTTPWADDELSVSDVAFQHEPSVAEGAVKSALARLQKMDRKLDRGARDHSDERALTTRALRELIDDDVRACAAEARKALAEWIRNEATRGDKLRRQFAEMRVRDLMNALGSAITKIELDALDSQDREWRHNRGMVPSGKADKRAERIVTRIMDDNRDTTGRDQDRV
jgi:hypothetical protein